jgi:hypothetical protein
MANSEIEALRHRKDIASFDRAVVVIDENLVDGGLAID